MKTHVEFRSDKFAPYEGEDEQVNPGRWGKRLAEFLASGLKRQGFDVQQLFAEDWGWVVPIRNQNFTLWIGCGNYNEFPDGDGFICFIEPHKPVVRRWFKKIDTTEQVNAVQTAMERLLSSEPSIRDIRWWTYDEFNNPCGQPGERRSD